MAKYLGGKGNPKKGFENDICIYVKILPPDNPPKRSYSDVDDSPKAAKWLKRHPEVGVIAISETAKDYLCKFLGRGDVVFIPHQHCNFERDLRPDRPVKTVGIIGSNITAFQAPVEPFRKRLAKMGLELKFEQDYWNTYKSTSKQEMRLNVRHTRLRRVSAVTCTLSGNYSSRHAHLSSLDGGRGMRSRWRRHS